jgi:UrcA family protein
MNRHSIKTRTFGLMLGFVGTLGVAFAAHAGDEMPSTAFVHESAVVRYDDLSLDSAAGIKALYARLTHAAAQVCGSQPHVAELRRLAQYRSCYNSALNKAIDKIDNDNLQALHEDRSATKTVG